MSATDGLFDRRVLLDGLVDIVPIGMLALLVFPFLAYAPCLADAETIAPGDDNGQ